MRNIELVKESIINVMTPSKDIVDAGYHHNRNYNDAIVVCKHGIMTISDLNTLGIRNDTPEALKTMSDSESHVNGIDAVSLSVVGLRDIYDDEDVYDPFNPRCVDFLIDKNVKAGRSSIHYANEFLCHRSIDVDELRSVDIRLLKLIQLVKSNDRETTIFNGVNDNTIINNYNCLIDIAREIENQGLPIPLREMSDDSKVYRLDICELAKKSKM